MENRSKIYIGLIIVLLVTNLATIGSVWYHIYAEKKNGTPGKTEVPGEQRTHFLAGQLNLDVQQTDKFRNLNRMFNRTANPITRELEHLRLEMLEELVADEPDTARLEKTALEIGSLHTELKKATIDFYLQMKSVCNKEQQMKLYQIFHSMLNQEEDVKLPRGRHQGGRGGNRFNN